MDYSKYVYIASCVFTYTYPELSFRIQYYLKQRFGIQSIRCCVEKYKVREFEKSMPTCISKQWKETPHYTPFAKDNVMVSICHNCSAIFQERHPDIKVISLWELILNDKDFSYPDYAGEKMTIQDCWRSYDNRNEQDAIRIILQKMNVVTVELEENYDRTDFCGITLYQPTPTRNLKLAPKRFVENAVGKFLPHTEQEKEQLMLDYCQVFTTQKVVAYCHYCTKGLELGKKHIMHIAELLFI